MKTEALLAATLLLTANIACNRDTLEPTEPTEVAPIVSDLETDTVASWNGGRLSILDIERELANAQGPACIETRSQAGGGSVDAWVPCYEEIARALALEDLVRFENPDFDQAVLDESNADLAGLRRAAIERIYLQRLADSTQISEIQVEEEWAANPQDYRHQASVVLFNIFMRHQDPKNPEATDIILRKLAERFESGESWESLARQHSESETRFLGGSVGTVLEGQLPDRLDRVVFSLPAGGVSEPIRVRDGAVLFHVREVIEGAEGQIDEFRRHIVSRLRQEEIQTAIAATLVDADLPEHATVLSLEDIIATLDGSDPEARVLIIGDSFLTVTQLRGAAGVAPLAKAASLDEEARQTLQQTYTRLKNAWMLPYVLEQQATPALSDEVTQEIAAMGIRMLIDEKIRKELVERAERKPERLRAFWLDNQQHFQTPLRYRIRHWRLPFGDNPPRQLAEMERLFHLLQAGRIDLDQARNELGGEIEERGWIEHGTLALQLPPKGAAYLSQIGPEGFSVPYQQAKALHMVHVIEREEPRRLTLEHAREEVLRSYVDRYRHELFREVADERLAAAEFVFLGNEVRRLLMPSL